MAASNYNWVCFRCRLTKRQPKPARTVPVCPECEVELYCLGYKVEIPRKLDLRGWRKLQVDCRRRSMALADRQEEKRVREVHAAEREIARLRALGPAKGRQKIIKELERRTRA